MPSSHRLDHYAIARKSSDTYPKANISLFDGNLRHSFSSTLLNSFANAKAVISFLVAVTLHASE